MESCANRNETATAATSGAMPNATSTPTNATSISGESLPKEATNTLKKRVHFSTQNSMVQVPRLDASTISSSDGCNAKDLSYATIYSNDYEPIGSEKNSSNHYVDMDSKLDDERPTLNEKPKNSSGPPLPPKPPNLLKLRQILKMPSLPLQPTPTLKPMDNESEPDYCSIGDVQETMKIVQIVAHADVHKNADDDVSSHASEETKTDMTDETFADIPKLPNVVALLSPKKDSSYNKMISPENYVTKSSPSPPRAKPAVLPTKAVVANLRMSKKKMTTELDESTKKIPIKLINQQKMTTIVETTTTTQQQNSTSNPMKALPILKQNDKVLMPIQAEFDWYNFEDVEYGKLLPANLLESGKDSERVEYNLDAEYGQLLPPNLLENGMY